MPELPEVQTIASDLNRVLPGLKIRALWTDWKKMFKEPKNFNDFKSELIGKKIIKVRRKGKNVLIDLSAGKTLLIHQKMTGHLLYGSWRFEVRSWKSETIGPLRDDSRNQYLHLVISLSNGKQLALSDLRKFAKVLIWQTDKLGGLDDLKKLGPDPLDKSFTFEKFEKIIGGGPQNSGGLAAGSSAAKPPETNKGKIKQFLMDQTKISGIGNIYSDEILWEAGIHPLKKINFLKRDELKKIYKAVKKVLLKAIKAKGDSMSDYRRPSGEKGGYQEMQNAYRQTGKKCGKNDGGVITRIKLGGRSGHFCPIHQVL